MEIILLIAALVTILWVATGLIGLERVRQWLRLVENRPMWLLTATNNARRMAR